MSKFPTVYELCEGVGAMTYIHDLCVRIGDPATKADTILTDLDKLYTIAQDDEKNAMMAVYDKHFAETREAPTWDRERFNRYCYEYIHCLHMKGHRNLDNIVDLFYTGHPIKVSCREPMDNDHEIARLGNYQHYLEK
jgi:hypothetical protein